MIVFNNYDSYPKELFRLVDSNSIFSQFVYYDEVEPNRFIGCFDEFWSKRNDSESQSIKAKCRRILQDEKIKGCHLCRAMSEDSYRINGIQLLDRDKYIMDMRSILIQTECPVKEANGCLATLWRFLSNKNENDRINRISLFYPPSDYVLYKKESAGYIVQYTKYLGGEVAAKALNQSGFVNVKNILRTYGFPLLISFEFSYRDIIKNSGEYPIDFADNQFIASILMKNRGINTSQNIFLANIECPVPPENIKDFRRLE